MKLKKKAKRINAKTITSLKMTDGRVVTDPAEIVRLLRADGFTVDELTGKLGLTHGLRDRSRPQ